ncbi:hypothetical protein V8E54_004832 [Elaphomyces granulatus]
MWELKPRFNSNYICLKPGIRGSPWFPGEACSSAITSDGSINVTTTNAQGGGTMVTMLNAGIDGINAFGVIIRYQSISTIAVTSAPESVIMPISRPTASTPSASSSSSPSIITSTALGATSGNTSRNIGIGVGVSLGSIVILSIIFAILFVRRRGPSEEVSELQASKLYLNRSELDGINRSELDGINRSELDGVNRSELDGVNRSELDGSGRQPRTGINLGQDSRIVQLLG